MLDMKSHLSKLTFYVGQSICKFIRVKTYVCKVIADDSLEPLSKAANEN